MKNPKLTGKPGPMFNHPHSEEFFFLDLITVSLAAASVHCLLLFCCEPLTGVYLHILYKSLLRS